MGAPCPPKTRRAHATGGGLRLYPKTRRAHATGGVLRSVAASQCQFKVVAVAEPPLICSKLPDARRVLISPRRYLLDSPPPTPPRPRAAARRRTLPVRLAHLLSARSSASRLPARGSQAARHTATSRACVCGGWLRACESRAAPQPEASALALGLEAGALLRRSECVN